MCNNMEPLYNIYMSIDDDDDNVMMIMTQGERV